MNANCDCIRTITCTQISHEWKYGKPNHNGNGMCKMHSNVQNYLIDTELAATFV